VEIQSLIASFFPTGAALFAAAASVSKARCEVDASAASTAAATGMTGESDPDGDPFVKVLGLIRMSLKTAKARIGLKIFRLKSKTLNLYRASLVLALKYRMQIGNQLSRTFGPKETCDI
jgi:hypothetical protein